MSKFGTTAGEALYSTCNPQTTGILNIMLQHIQMHHELLHAQSILQEPKHSQQQNHPKYSDYYYNIFYTYHHHHHVHEGLGVFPVP